VLTACSKTNFDYVKSLGADHVFDARDPDIGSKIRSFTDNKLYYTFDCLAEYGSPAQCANALASSAPPGQELRYGNIQIPDGGPRQDVINTFSNGFTATGEDFEIQIAGNWVKIEGKKDHYEFMRDWLALAGKLFAEGKWKPHRVEVREGGLEGVLEGLKDLEDGRVSGVKLVYRVGEI
jgi:NADPH:quinone reductase-like Zn-dependent oxidoreductase